MTVTALVLTVIGSLTLPRLPSPASYTVVVPPVLLVMAIMYERVSTINSRLRLALALWMGFSVLVLTVGIVFAGSSSTGLIGTFAVFFVLGMAGVITVGVLHGRQLRGLSKHVGVS